MPLSTIIGIDIGGTKTAVVEGSGDAEILQRREVPTEARGPFDTSFARIIDLIESVIRESKRAGRRPVAMSVSVGGPLRIAEGFLIDPPHLPAWHGIPLKAHLTQRFPALPVFVEHDGNAGALAEFRFGAGMGKDDLLHLVFLTFGTGIGAGIIVNGSILHGATDTAGEVGHWRLADSGPTGFGKAGSWEGYASGAGLVSLAHHRFPGHWSPSLTIRDLVNHMLDGDACARAIGREAGAWMGRGMALIVDAFNPQMIVVGSLANVLGDIILDPAREVLRAEALPQAFAACEIKPAVLGSGIGDVASLMAALTAQGIDRLLSSA